MIAEYVAGLTALAASAAFCMSALAAPTAFDPHRCSSIQNVEVPYDVSLAANRIAFTGSGKHIVVAAAYMDVDGQRFVDPNLSAAYYRDVRGFLHSAGAFPRTAAEFGRTAFLLGHSEAKQNFRDGLTAMCRAILSLADDQKRMRGAFAGFVSPVEITLSD